MSKVSCLFLVLFVTVAIATNSASNDTETTEDATANSNGGQTNSSTSVTPTTQGTSTGCLSYTSCSSCTSDASCVWCNNDGNGACGDGKFWGSDDTCSDWRWKQCFVNGKYALYGVLGLAGLILLCCCLCICKCCLCPSKKKHRKKTPTFKEFKNLAEEEEGLLEFSKTPKTDARRAELMKKYGSKLGSHNSQKH